MSGEKIEQAKGAAKFVLNNLREGDLFNIVAYDSEIATFRPELQKFNDETRAAAARLRRRPVRRRQHRTSMAPSSGPSACSPTASRPTYVLFLTDGLPTERRNGRSGHRQAQRGSQRRAGPRVCLRRRLRRQQPAARQAGPRQLRPEPIRAAERRHRSRGQRALSQDRRAGDDRRGGDGRRRRRDGQRRADRQPRLSEGRRSTCLPATRSCSSAAITTAARPR